MEYKVIVNDPATNTTSVHVISAGDNIGVIDDAKELFKGCEIIDIYSAAQSCLDRARRVNRNLQTAGYRYGLPDDCIGRKIDVKGHPTKIIGLEPKNTKYKVLIYDETIGKTYKATPQCIEKIIRENGYIEEGDEDGGLSENNTP